MVAHAAGRFSSGSGGGAGTWRDAREQSPVPLSGVAARSKSRVVGIASAPRFGPHVPGLDPSFAAPRLVDQRGDAADDDPARHQPQREQEERSLAHALFSSAARAFS